MNRRNPLLQLPARERILLTAHDLFYRDGIRSTGIDRVIAESGVAKVTFYRHFPSKNELIIAFLEYRHHRWMTWFREALKRHGENIEALVPALREWFISDDYRGCAFINSTGEVGKTIPGINEITRNHKREMTSVIAHLLPQNPERDAMASAIALAVDGAIIKAQYDEARDEALQALSWILESLEKGNNRTTVKKRTRNLNSPLI